MIVRLILCLPILGALVTLNNSHLSTPLPAEWHGIWSGKLAIVNAADKASEVAVTLKIEPIKGSDEVTWAITYGEGAKASLRDYKLVPVADKPGCFQIDEKNGIMLDARLVNGVLYSYFEVGGSLLTARYELQGDLLRFEITSAKPSKAKSGYGKVQAYPVDVVQRAELRKR